jgi:hypothetical protein
MIGTGRQGSGPQHGWSYRHRRRRRGGGGSTDDSRSYGRLKKTHGGRVGAENNLVIGYGKDRCLVRERVCVYVYVCVCVCVQQGLNNLYEPTCDDWREKYDFLVRCPPPLRWSVFLRE